MIIQEAGGLCYYDGKRSPECVMGNQKPGRRHGLIKVHLEPYKTFVEIPWRRRTGQRPLLAGRIPMPYLLGVRWQASGRRGSQQIRQETAGSKSPARISLNGRPNPSGDVYAVYGNFQES